MNKSVDLDPSEYGAYYSHYIQLAGNGDLITCLKDSFQKTFSFLESVPDEKMDYAYADGKWTIKEIVQHLIDSERIFSYRALRLARQDAKDLPGYDHDYYVPVSKACERSKEDLLDEYKSVRAATLSLYKTMDEQMLKFIGTANNNPFSARALAFIIAGHETHHIGVIAGRYL